MTPAQNRLRELQDRQSRERGRMAELSLLDQLDAETRSELDGIEAGTADLERQLRAAQLAVDAEDAAAVVESAADAGGDRELRALRERVTVGAFVAAAVTGIEARGAEAEYLAATGVPPGPHIPLALFEPTPTERDAAEKRAATTSPSTVGVNLAPIFPSIFARAVLPRCGVTMPMVESGTAAVATITTDLTAGAEAAGDARAASAATFTVDSTTPHRVSAALEVRIEDIAAVGTGNFEAALRQNLQLALSSQLDALGLTGSGSGAVPQGLLPQLTDPTDDTDVANWGRFVGMVADGIDGGPWAESMRDVMVVVNAETMRLAEQTFRQPGSVGTPTNAYSDTPGEMSAAAYLRANSGGLIASSRMPATASNIAQVLRVRRATMGLDGVNAVELARCPVWSYLAIDDIYTMSTAGTRRFSVHALIGDVMIVQANAFARVDLKVS